MSSSEFPAGFSVEWDKQVYRPVGLRKHTTKAGASVELVEWETECPRCNKVFALTTLMKFTAPRRRCDDCKAPGRRVATDRKHFMAQIAGTSP